MTVQDPRNLRILRIYQMLQKTDKNNPIMQKEILSKLETDYGIGVERKTVARDLESLVGTEEFHVVKSRDGWYIDKEKFTDFEIKILADAAASANFIDMKTTKDILGKLKDLVGTSTAETIDKTTILDSQIKVKDSAINEKISLILKAIEQKRKIRFTYTSKNTIHDYDPFYLVFTNNDYYILVSLSVEKGKDIVLHYNLSNIEDIEILEEPCKKINEVPGMKEFSTANKLGKYLREHPNFFSGNDIVRVSLVCNNGCKELIRKNFGTSDFFNRPDGTFSVTVNVGISETAKGEGLYYKLATFGPDIKVEHPKDIKEGYIKYLKDTLARYE